MPASDPSAILLAHNHWATAALLAACRGLSDEDFHRRFEIGPGSLHDTITHILGALQGWGDLLAGRDNRPRLEGTRRTVDQLSELLDELASDIERSVRNHPAEEQVTGSRGGRSFTFTRGAVLTHVMTHGMHHRAQCLNMLRHLGVDPLPPSSVLEWTLMVDDPANA